jgi:hypothetical protein
MTLEWLLFALIVGVLAVVAALVAILVVLIWFLATLNRLIASLRSLSTQMDQVLYDSKQWLDLGHRGVSELNAQRRPES